MPISIEVATDKLRKLAAHVEDTELANRQLGIELEGWVLRNFQAEGGLLGTGWEPLKPETIARRTKGRRSTGTVMILQDTGQLRASFDSFFDKEVAGVGAAADKPHADISERHQEGDPSRNLPARPMLPTREIALELAYKVYEWHLQEARKEADL